MRRSEWTDPARQDLGKIHDFYRQTAPDYAARVARAAAAAGRFLCQHPLAGAEIDIDVRKWPVPQTKFRLFYRVLEDRIQILRIRHVREDWATDD
jgi:toxin ParE1/3/4